MALLRNITVSLDFLFPPKLEISACFTSAKGETDEKLVQCINEVALYRTEHSTIYLFPVFKALAAKHGLKFSVRYNMIFSIRRYIYATLLSISNFFVSKKGIEEYKIRMDVTYDGF